jgi:hypothetical protein
MWIWVWIPLLGNVHQDCHLVIVLVHILHFILNLKLYFLAKLIIDTIVSLKSVSDSS